MTKHPQYHPVLIFRPGIWRIITGPFRVLPDFLIIGAGKCGTSSAYNYLIEHPNIYPAKIKELNYFVRKWTRWYRPNFPTIFLKYYLKKIRKEPFLTGEASPFYLLNPFVAKEVKEQIPNVKIIIFLRDPIDRSFSQYSQWQKTEYEKLSFEEVIKQEKIKTKKDWENYIDDGSIDNRDHVRHAYLEGGLYYNQIKIWMDIFPKKQFLIIKSEDFFSNPAKILSEIFIFLGIKNYRIDVSKKYNVGSYYQMNPETKEFLKKFFKTHNENLIKLLGEKFKWEN